MQMAENALTHDFQRFTRFYLALTSDMNPDDETGMVPLGDGPMTFLTLVRTRGHLRSARVAQLWSGT